MERISVNIKVIPDSPSSPNLQDKPSEEFVWDSVYKIMTNNPGKEYLKYILAYEWVEKAPTRLMTTSEKPSFKMGTMTWYVKVYVK
jgi:hypothetical protein